MAEENNISIEQRAAESVVFQMTPERARGNLFKEAADNDLFLSGYACVFEAATMRDDKKSAKGGYALMLEVFRRSRKPEMQILISEVEREFPYLKKQEVKEGDIAREE